MVVQLTLGSSAQVPSSQLEVAWQGVRPGDSLDVVWTDTRGLSRWSGGVSLDWIRRDGFQAAESWQVDLDRVPASIELLTLGASSATPGSVGLALVPLDGSPADALRHPGVRLAADQRAELIQLRRVGTGWNATAVNLVGRQGYIIPAMAPTGQSRISVDKHQSDAVPAHLDAAVSRIRSVCIDESYPRVSVVVDLSASMSAWIRSGALADTLTAIMAVACASSRRSVIIRWVPDGTVVEVPIDAVTTELLTVAVARTGLQTGLPAAFRAAVVTAAQGGGLVFQVTDNPFTATDVANLVSVVVGSDSLATAVAGRSAPGAVSGEVVDIAALAHDLAVAAVSVYRMD